MIKRRTVPAATAGAGLARVARAAGPVKVGLILPMTGPFASTGREIDAACRLYVQQNPAAAIEIVLRDDAGVVNVPIHSLPKRAPYADEGGPSKDFKSDAGGSFNLTRK